MPHTLVPPGRLGSLLREQRDRHAWSVADLARQSDRFDANALDRIERGGAQLSDADVQAALQLYQLDLSNGTYGRSELVIDLNRGAIAVGDTRLQFEGSTADLVLERYVSLLYVLREETVGKRLSLRDDDLDTLSRTIDRSHERLVTDLHTIMSDRSTVGRTRRLARKPRILKAGLLVGATIAGALIIVGDVLPAAAAVAQPIDSEERSALLMQRTGFDISESLPGWTINWAADHPTFGGMTNASERSITVHVDSSWSEDRLLDIAMHEVGHAIDLEYLDDDQRREWMIMRGIDTSWWTADAQPDFHVGAGDFAEAVAALTADGASDSSYGEFTNDQLDFVRHIIDGIAHNQRVKSA